MVQPIPAVGLSVLSDPADAVIDIVFVHGLQGHPENTWTWKPNDRSDKSTSSRHPKTDKKGSRNVFRAVFSPSRRVTPTPPSSSSTPAQPDDSGTEGETSAVYWPRDLLAADFPKARVMTFGYNTIVTDGYRAANQASLFAHSRDLLYALEAKRRSAPDRPLVYIAHSLGGILTKEVLRRSDVDPDTKVKKVFDSTVGVFFMGTPHRGSRDWVSFGEGMAKLVSFLGGVDVNTDIVHALLPTGPELDLCRESFAIQWVKRGNSLTVRTFQESKGSTGVRWGGFNKLIVPPDSSSLDHPNQRPRTIDGNHKVMCKFCGPDDPGYIMVKDDIAELVEQAETRISTLVVPLNTKNVGWLSPGLMPMQIDIELPVSSRNDDENFRNCLRSLWFPEMEYRRSQIERPHPETSKWLFAEERYVAWSEHINPEEHQGLLWIKGKPGAGKSTLMKKAFNDACTQQPVAGGVYAGFFFQSRGNVELQRTSLSLFRSLWHQLLKSDEVLRSRFLPSFLAKGPLSNTPAHGMWILDELKDLFEQALIGHDRPIILFIDGLDECVETEIRDLVYFFRGITKTATSNDRRLSVCLSSRHYPHITVTNCPEIIVEAKNQNDIDIYVHAQLFPNEQSGMYAETREEIVKRAGGIFLWTVLVVRILLEDFDSGRISNSISLQTRLDMVPTRLEELFIDLFKDPVESDLRLTTFLIQAVLFASRPLGDREMAQCLAFGTNEYQSLQQWKTSPSYIGDMKVFENRVRALSRGLIEITSDHKVQFIHQSVRDFFLSQRGIKLSGKNLDIDPAGQAHLAIIMAFLNLMRATELACLVGISKKEFRDLKVLDNSGLGYEKVRGYSPKKRELFFSKQLLFLWDEFDGCQLAWYIGDNIMHQLSAADKAGAPVEPALELLLQLEDTVWPRIESTRTIMAPFFIRRRGPEPPLVSPMLNAFVDANLVMSVGLLLSLGASIPEITEDTSPLLLNAAKQWSPEDLDILLINGAEPSVRDISGRTILHIYAGRNHEEGVLKALSLGIDIDATNQAKQTALHHTVFHGYLSLSEVLLERGASVDAKDRDMRTPLFSAQKKDDTQHIALLLKYGADPCAIDFNDDDDDEDYGNITGYWVRTRDSLSCEDDEDEVEDEDEFERISMVLGSGFKKR